MTRRQWTTTGLAAFLLIGVVLMHSFIAKPVLAAADDDVRTITQIVMDEDRITGVNRESVALEENRLADTVTLVTATGVVKHVQKDAILGRLRNETGDARISIEVSDVQAYLNGDAAIVTYQKENSSGQRRDVRHAEPDRPSHVVYGHLREAQRTVESSGYSRSLAVASS